MGNSLQKQSAQHDQKELSAISLEPSTEVMSNTFLHLYNIMIDEKHIGLGKKILFIGEHHGEFPEVIGSFINALKFDIRSGTSPTDLIENTIALTETVDPKELVKIKQLHIDGKTNKYSKTLSALEISDDRVEMSKISTISTTREAFADILGDNHVFDVDTLRDYMFFLTGISKIRTVILNETSTTIGNEIIVHEIMPTKYFTDDVILKSEYKYDTGILTLQTQLNIMVRIVDKYIQEFINNIISALQNYTGFQQSNIDLILEPIVKLSQLFCSIHNGRAKPSENTTRIIMQNMRRLLTIMLNKMLVKKDLAIRIMKEFSIIKDREAKENIISVTEFVEEQNLTADTIISNSMRNNDAQSEKKIIINDYIDSDDLYDFLEKMLVTQTTFILDIYAFADLCFSEYQTVVTHFGALHSKKICEILQNIGYTKKSMITNDSDTENSGSSDTENSGSSDTENSSSSDTENSSSSDTENSSSSDTENSSSSDTLEHIQYVHMNYNKPVGLIKLAHQLGYPLASGMLSLYLNNIQVDDVETIHKLHTDVKNIENITEKIKTTSPSRFKHPPTDITVYLRPSAYPLLDIYGMLSIAIARNDDFTSMFYYQELLKHVFPDKVKIIDENYCDIDEYKSVCDTIVENAYNLSDKQKIMLLIIDLFAKCMNTTGAVEFFKILLSKYNIRSTVNINSNKLRFSNRCDNILHLLNILSLNNAFIPFSYDVSDLHKYPITQRIGGCDKISYLFISIFIALCIILIVFVFNLIMKYVYKPDDETYSCTYMTEYDIDNL